MSENNNGLKRQIGLFGAVTILVGAVIGSGIFMTPGTVAAAAGSFGPFMAAWILAGASGILCALVYAELSPAMPEAGGPYVYITEAYGKGGGFLSSGHDGFMREFVNLPADRVVAFDDIDKRIAAITEFISVGMHAYLRFSLISHEYKNSIGIWGDGSLAFIVSSILKKKYPDTKIIVIGKNTSKLSQFSFVDETILADDLEEGFNVDHAFECAGGEGSFYAIDNIIKYINPQGTVMLMGVSENKVPINTRDILEKGLTFVGSSRSGRVDFENAIKFMEDKSIQRRLKSIIYETDEVKNISDIHKAFSVDIDTDFKTVFKWSV